MIKKLDPEAAVREYARQLRDIYDHRLAGDYTFHGILYEFLVAVNGWVVKPTDEKLLEEEQATLHPHSPSCTTEKHEHGLRCHSYCPTCGGFDLNVHHIMYTAGPHYPDGSCCESKLVQNWPPRGEQFDPTKHDLKKAGPHWQSGTCCSEVNRFGEKIPD